MVLTALLAMSALKATLGLVIIFFVLFPLLIHGLILFSGAQVAREHRENARYLDGVDDDVGAKR